jgi:glutamine synthetase
MTTDPSGAPEAASELHTFLESHPQVRGADILLCDVGGVLRGKRLRRHELERLYREGRWLPSSIMGLTFTGEDVEETGLVWDVGDCDCLARPVAGTLVPVPWLEQPLAQLLVMLDPVAGMPAAVADPRAVLQRVIDRLRAEGYVPVVAAELEFYLLGRDPGADGQPVPAQPSKAPPRIRQTDVYSVAELTDFSAFLEALYDCCTAQGIPAETAISEYAPGQFEITLTHRNDALRAIDETVMYKRAVKGVAMQFDMTACFMAKPFSERAGSGLHLHASLANTGGVNLFAGDDPHAHPLLRHAVGGLLHTMHEAFVLFAPNGNSYRRFRSNSYAPTLPTWGWNNRTVSVRIPRGSAASRHIEHRVCGADANPYLVAAAVLAGMHCGITREIDPGEPMSGDGYRIADSGAFKPMPKTWSAALDAMEASDFVADYLGEGFRKVYLAIKRREADRFASEVTALDYDWYLRDA